MNDIQSPSQTVPDVVDYTYLGTLIYDQLELSGISEQQFCDRMQRYDIGDELLDNELTACYIKETNEQAIRIPGFGVVAVGPTGEPSTLLNSIECGIFMGHIIKLHQREYIPVYIFHDGHSSTYKYKLRNPSAWTEYIRITFEECEPDGTASIYSRFIASAHRNK